MGRPPSDSHVALEQQVETMLRLRHPSERLSYQCEQFARDVNDWNANQGAFPKYGKPTTTEAWCLGLAESIERAETYNIAGHMVELIQSAKATLPSFPARAYHVPCETGFCYLAKPAPIDVPVKGSPARAFFWEMYPNPIDAPCGVDIEGAGRCAACGHFHATSLLWMPFTTHDWGTEPNYLVPTGGAVLGLTNDKPWDNYSVKDGDTGEDMRDWESISMDSLRFFMSFLCLIKQKCVLEVHEKVPRSTRRRLPDDWRPEPTVRTILLRKYAEEVGRPGHSDVDWQCKWWVGGHWRDQWHPSIKAHSPVYIASYIKGPEDKPLKAPDKVLFNVAR